MDHHTQSIPTPTRKPAGGSRDAPERVLRLSCDECSMAHPDACSDCVVAYICTREPDDAVVLDLDEHRALRRLAASGLLPELRHEPSAGAGR